MKKHFRMYALAALAMACSMAQATICRDGSEYNQHWENNCDNPLKNPAKDVASTTNTNTAVSGSAAKAGSKSRSASRSDSRSASNATGGQGGNSTAAATGGDQQQAQRQEQLNQQGTVVQIDQSSTGGGGNRGDTIIIPPGLPPLPGGVALPSSNIAILPGRACGPRQMIVKTAVYGREYGWNGDGAEMIIAYRDAAVPITDGNGVPMLPQIDYVAGVGIGSIKSSAWAKVGVSINNALGVSLYHKATGGSAQGASGGQIEILVRDDVIEDCFYDLPKKIIHAPPPPPEIRYVSSKPRIIYKDRPKPLPCCIPMPQVCCIKQ